MTKLSCTDIDPAAGVVEACSVAGTPRTGDPLGKFCEIVDASDPPLNIL